MNKSQKILIAGATGNIGGGVALPLAKRGAEIILLGRNKDKLETRKKLINSNVAEDVNIYGNME